VYDVATRAVLSAYGTKGGGIGRFNLPGGVAVDPWNGDMLVADTLNNRVVELAVSSTGVVTWVRAIRGFAAPDGVAADSTGRIYVANTGSSSVAILNPDGSLLGTLTSDDGFNHPSAVAVDANGLVYVSDTFNDRIQVYSWNVEP